MANRIFHLQLFRNLVKSHIIGLEFVVRGFVLLVEERTTENHRLQRVGGAGEVELTGVLLEREVRKVHPAGHLDPDHCGKGNGLVTTQGQGVHGEDDDLPLEPDKVVDVQVGLPEPVQESEIQVYGQALAVVYGVKHDPGFKPRVGEVADKDEGLGLSVHTRDILDEEGDVDPNSDVFHRTEVNVNVNVNVFRQTYVNMTFTVRCPPSLSDIIKRL